jgi:hypothetical protein
MEYVTLAAGLLLPWLAGSLWIAALWPSAHTGETAHGLRIADSGRLAVIVGYGHVLGLLALTLLMRGASVAGVPFGWTSVGLPLALAAAGASLALWRRRRASPAGDAAAEANALPPEDAATGSAWGALRPAERFLAWILVALLVHRAGAIAVELWLRPIYPWDAFAQWSTKARVWFETGRLSPFLPTAEWLAAQGEAFTDAAPGYPATVPLLQTWTAVALGRWDPSLVNLPWLLCAIALGAGLFGQLRVAGLPLLWSLFGAYAVASLPFLNAHAALGGYADLHMATVYGLAAIAFANWAAARAANRRSAASVAEPVADAAPAALAQSLANARPLANARSMANLRPLANACRINGAMALLLALSLPLWKNPGPVWLASFGPALAMALAPRAGLRIVAALAIVGALAVGLLAATNPVILNYQLHLDFTWVGGALARNMFTLGNWHVLWWAVPTVLLAGRRQLLTPALAPATVLLATGAAILFVVFFFSNAATWVTDYSTVNRALLHVVPYVAFVAVVVAWRWWRVGSSPSRSLDPLKTAGADDGS